MKNLIYKVVENPESAELIKKDRIKKEAVLLTRPGEEAPALLLPLSTVIKELNNKMDRDPYKLSLSENIEITTPTPEDLKDILYYYYQAYGLETGRQTLQAARIIIKVNNYSEDGPGYRGPIFIIFFGSLERPDILINRIEQKTKLINL